MIDSNLMMKNLAFTKIMTKRMFSLPDNVEINGSFDIKYEEVNENEINVFLIYNAKSKKNEIEIEIELQGNFSVRDIDDDSVKRYLLHVNTIAIMFPYLRSQISLATNQPGFIPIQIPIVNAVALARAAGFND